MTASADVLIVGGGPAGLSAAVAASGHGLRVTIVDESDQLGGQYFRQPRPGMEHRDHRPAGRRLIERVVDSGAEILTGWSVWGVDNQDLLVAPRRGGHSRRLQGRRILLATGAHELLLPFPGWQLPGVVTPGFALHTTASEGVAVGGRVLLAGTGPFLIVVAQQLLQAGVRVVGVAEEAVLVPTADTVRRSLPHPARLGQMAGLMGTLIRHRVPWWRGAHLLSVEEGTGGDRVARIRRHRSGGRATETVVTADVVCVAYGFRPNSELSRLLGCEWRLDPYSLSPVPVTDPFGKTSLDGVYSVGDAAGIGGAELAMAKADLAVADIVRREGLPLSARAVERRRRTVARLERFAALNRELFTPPFRALDDVDDDVVVCRCEHVVAGDVRDAGRSGWHDLSGIKGATRAGMGPCQGRECGTAVAALAGGSPAEYSPWSVRMPIRPVSLAAAARIVPNQPLSPSDSGSER